MWLCHMPLHCPKEKEKKNKIVNVQVFYNNMCQRMKNCIKVPVKRLIANKVPERLLENIYNTVSLDSLYKGLVTLKESSSRIWEKT